MVKDMIIGSFSNYKDYDLIRPWVESIRKVGFDGYKVVIVSNIANDIVTKLQDEGFEVIVKSLPESLSNVVVDRFFSIAEYLSDHKEDIRYVITTDIRDVIFQKNPSEFLDNITADIIASREGFAYKHEPWSKNNMIQSFGEEIYEDMKDWQICCAGTIAGKKESLIRLFTDIWNYCSNKPPYIVGGGGPDQAAYNILLKKIQSNDPETNILFLTNDDEWAAQLGTTIPAIKAGSGDIGFAYRQSFFSNLYLDEIKKNIQAHEPHIMNSVVYNINQKPYYIIHQYNRIPKWEKEILGIKDEVIDLTPKFKPNYIVTNDPDYKRKS